MGSEKRKQKRFPVMKDLAEPVDLILLESPPREIPSVMTNLSAGGMSVLAFAPVHGAAALQLVLNIPGLEGVKLDGKIAWQKPKGDTTQLGIEFHHVSEEAKRKIVRLAEAYQDCELKLSFGLRDVCFRACSYWALCAKPVKLKE